MSNETAHEAQLRRWAKGVTTCEAATELVIRAGFGEPGQPWVNPQGWIDFAEIEENIGALSGGQQRVLRIAASLHGSLKIDLGTEVAGIDRTFLELVLAAIAHVHGEGADIIEHAGGGASLVTLPVAHAWPGETSS
jgi:hypothetical protein